MEGLHLGDGEGPYFFLTMAIVALPLRAVRGSVTTADGRVPNERPSSASVVVQSSRPVRLRHAADMLRSGNQMSIKEISFATGFASVSYFSRCFHAMYGVSPTQYASEAG